MNYKQQRTVEKKRFREAKRVWEVKESTENYSVKQEREQEVIMLWNSSLLDDDLLDFE